MDYIDNDDYWAKQWHLEALSEEHYIEQQRIEKQNASGVDMPFLGRYCAPIDFTDCITVSEEVPF